MNYRGRFHVSRQPKKWRKVNVWSVKGPIFVVALLLGFFDHALHWGGASFAAGLAMALPIIGFRDFWNQTRFWITVLLLAALQVPLAVGVGPLIEQQKFPAMFAFGVLDCIFVALAISFVCSEHGGRSV
jgi:hypothetical protein